jgi:hypothetical protein
MEAGLKTVPCEIIVADRLEAMRQSFNRNRHGVNNPLALGRFFKRMLKEGSLSIRGLAKKLRVPESRIRICLFYCKAADLRNRCAPQDADKKIAALSVKQVTAYLQLPADKANKLLEKGGDFDKALQVHRAKTNKRSACKPAGGEQSRAIKRGREQVDRSTLKALEDCWAIANATTRRAFITAIVADASVLTLVSEVIKQS